MSDTPQEAAASVVGSDTGSVDRGARSIAIDQLVHEKLARDTWGLLGNQGYILGIDLGGYGLRAALINLHTHVYTSVHQDIENDTPEHILQTTLAMAQSLLDEAKVTSNRLLRIGVGFNGPVAPSQGKVLPSTRRTGWEHVDIKKFFEESLDTVTMVDNDANLIALGEATFGIGHGCHNLFYLHLSTGVGGGLVLGGRLYHGASAMAGEVGHTLICDEPSHHGKPPSLEAVLSVGGMLQRARDRGLAAEKLEDIFNDHPVGRQVVDDSVNILARRLAHIVALLDPNKIVLGGVVVRIGGERFVSKVQEHIGVYLSPTVVRPIEVVPSVLGADSIAIGALALALESLGE